MKDVSIEYAHIYTNQRIDEEHKLSLKVLDEVQASVIGTTSLVVMVDDYSFPDPEFNYEDFARWLKGHNLKPDLMIRESQLIPACDEVLTHVNDERLHRQLADYIRAKKYPCSLFIAAWYLLRLGKLKNSLVPETACAKQLINILPESFEPFEDKAFEIIRATEFAECVDSIFYHFLPGRLIA